MQTFFERLTQFAKQQGFNSINDFALKGLKYDSSSKLNRLRDGNKKPSVEILEDIANMFENANIHFLVTGKFPLVTNYSQKESKNDINEPHNDVNSAYQKTIEILKEQVADLKSDKEMLKALLLEKKGKNVSS